VDYHLSVAREQSGMELDEFLCRTFPLYSKRFLRRLVRDGRVLVDGGRVQPSRRLRSDEVVSIDIDEDAAEPAPVTAPVRELDVLYEDEQVLVVDKPADLAVEPDRWDPTRPSLIGALHALAGNLDDEEAPGRFRPRLVHRLDKDTSGVVLVAKTIEAERALGRDFDQGRVRKTYLALVEGEHPLADGEHEEIDLPLAPDRRRSGVMVVSEGGKPSRTRVQVEQRFRGYTLMRCEPITGRTHQLRVHLAAHGFPLVVDPLYGRRRSFSLSEFKSGYRSKPGRAEAPLIDRLTLHALRLEFPAPQDPSRTVVVESLPPRDFQRVLKQLSKVRAWRVRRA
jgi:23S rRNA pseudouridine1911/1915/1917 synthase